EASEVRITMRQAGEIPPDTKQPARLKDQSAAEQKLLWHLLDRTLELSESATGGYKRSMFENLLRVDVAKAKKWLDEQRAQGKIGAKEAPGYVRTLRVGQAEKVAASDADEAVALLTELGADPAFRALLRLGERFQKTDPERGLRFAEEAVLRARSMDP